MTKMNPWPVQLTGQYLAKTCSVMFKKQEGERKGRG